MRSQAAEVSEAKPRGVRMVGLWSRFFHRRTLASRLPQDRKEILFPNNLRLHKSYLSSNAGA
jgi:hypothetical protein